MSRVLYWGSGSPPCWRVLISLEEKGLPFESKLLEFSKGEHKSPEVLALNPRGQLPAFKDGDVVINESAAVCLYLEDRYPEKSLLPSDPAAKAHVLQRLFESLVAEDIMRLYVRPKFRKQDNPKEAQHIEGIKEELKLWDGYLGKTKYLATDDFTLADVMLAPNLLVMMRFGMTFKDYPNLKRYVDLVKEHPSVMKTAPPHWKDSEPTMDFMKIF